MDDRVHYEHGVVAWTLVDNGDGTGTRTIYTPDGEVESVEQLTGLPIPVEPEPDPVEALQAQVAELTAALQALLGETS